MFVLVIWVIFEVPLSNKFIILDIKVKISFRIIDDDELSL